MAQLNQEVRHSFDVKTTAGAPVTGLIQANFALVLRRQSGNTLVAASEVLTASEISAATLPGKYWIYYTPTADVTLYILEISHATHVVAPDEFQDQVESGYASGSGPYLTTRANVLAAFPQLGTKDHPLIDALLPAVTEYVHSFCGKKYTQEVLEEFHSARGWNAQTINLDRYPIAAIAAVHVSPFLPRVWDATTVLDATEDYTFNAKAGILRRIGGAWPFVGYYGDGSVRVQYTAGFSVIPAHVERAAIEIVAVKTFKSQKGLYHVTDEQLGEGQVRGLKWDDVPPHAREVLEMERSVAA